MQGAGPGRWGAWCAGWSGTCRTLVRVAPGPTPCLSRALAGSLGHRLVVFLTPPGLATSLLKDAVPAVPSAHGFLQPRRGARAPDTNSISLYDRGRVRFARPWGGLPCARRGLTQEEGARAPRRAPERQGLQWPGAAPPGPLPAGRLFPAALAPAPDSGSREVTHSLPGEGQNPGPRPQGEAEGQAGLGGGTGQVSARRSPRPCLGLGQGP